MLRKQIVPRRSSEPISLAGEISIADVATVQVTSEDADHPIDSAFDQDTKAVAGSPMDPGRRP
jgi:hypothetical protein